MKKLFTILLILFMANNINTAFAKTKKQAQKPLTLEQKIALINSKKLDNETKLYEIAKLKLDNDTYRVYRTAERLIRANKLDEYPWVFEIKYDDEVYSTNASTTEGNLVSLSFGSIKTYGDDVSELAFILGHEMAHEVQKHIPTQQRKIIAIQQELNDEMKKHNAHLEKKVEDFTFIQRILSPGVIYYTQEDLKRDENKIKELQEELAQETMTIARQQEYEADKLGLRYAIKAGFNPNSAQRAFVFISRVSGDIKGNPNSTHPRVDERIWNVKNELSEMNIQKLKQEGKNNLLSSKPLSFTDTNRLKNRQVSRRMLVVDSKYSTLQDKNDQFKVLFGK